MSCENCAKNMLLLDFTSRELADLKAKCVVGGKVGPSLIVVPQGAYTGMVEKLEAAELQVRDLTALLRRAEDALGPDRTASDRRDTLMVLGKALVEKRVDPYRQPKGKDVFGMLPDFPIPCGREWGNSEDMYGKCDRESGHNGPCGTEVR